MLVGLIAFMAVGIAGAVPFALVSLMVERTGLEVAEDRVYDRRL
jgi:hypothetical protein